MLNIFYYLLISVGINLILFIPAFSFKTDKLTDLSYSLSFIVLVVIALSLGSLSALHIVLALMVIAWGLRLGLFLFVRIKNMKKDKRFDGIRESFPKFFQFWVLQGISVWVILVPAFMAVNSGLSNVFWFGLAIWAIGIITESVADIQKYKFKQRSKNEFIKTGLWKYSRHPNYFGEILCWIGIYLFVVPSLSTLKQVLALVSPLFITVLLLFVTGIPQVEKHAIKKYGNRKDYQNYRRRTSILIPWPPKK